MIGQNQSEKLENQWRDLKGLKKEFEDLQNQLQKLNDLKKKFKDLENQLRKLNDLKKEFKDLENQLQKLNDLKKDMTAIINTTTDVYGLGMMLLKVLFRPDYFDQVAKNYFTAPRRHSDCDGNIRARDGFIANIDKIVDDLARMQNIYTPEQIDGIKHLIKWCMDKDPTKRPTAYQAGALIELLAAECSFEDSKKLAIEDNPTPKNYISEEAREVYEKRGLTASA
ncbi:MAG: hypothetical protein LBI81_02135 [Puniceicoccales bacterium]|nr:hypothetical protein [Puniceicoccales bacterium]